MKVFGEKKCTWESTTAQPDTRMGDFSADWVSIRYMAGRGISLAIGYLYFPFASIRNYFGFRLAVYPFPLPVQQNMDRISNHLWGPIGQYDHTRTLHAWPAGTESEVLKVAL